MFVLVIVVVLRFLESLETTRRSLMRNGQNAARKDGLYEFNEKLNPLEQTLGTLFGAYFRGNTMMEQGKHTHRILDTACTLLKKDLLFVHTIAFASALAFYKYLFGHHSTIIINPDVLTNMFRNLQLLFLPLPFH